MTWTVLADDGSGLWLIIEDGCAIASTESESIAKQICKDHNNI